MSAGHGLGTVVGSARAVAAVHHDGTRNEYDTIVRDATLRLADGEPILGAVPAGRDGEIVVDGFVARVGDPVGILTEDGSVYAGEDLTASAVACLVDLATPDHDDVPVVLAHPTVWPQRTVDVVLDALNRAGLPDVTPTTEAAAALEWLEHAEGPLGDGAIVVYDLGASTLDITVLRTGRDAGILGSPIRSDEVCGSQFDHATLQYVLAHVGEQAIDPFDPAAEHALRGVRAECARAKEALSRETETDLTVDLPGIRQQFRLVRSELEDLVRAPLTSTVSLVREAIHSAGLDVRDIDRVLLVGGGAAIPLVAELISTELGLPVSASDRPMDVTAVGAAVLASRIATHSGSIPADENPTVALALTSPTERRPVAAPRTNLATPATPEAVRGGMSRGRKAGIVVAAAAAITVLAAGGLSLGTGGSVIPHSTNKEQSSATTPESTGSSAPSTTDAAVADVGDRQTGSDVVDAGVPRSQGGSAASTDAPRAGSAAPAAPAAGNSAPAPDAQQSAPVGGGNAVTAGDQSAPAPVQSGGGQQTGGAQSGGQQGGGQSVQVPQVTVPDVNLPSPKVPNVQVPSVGGVLDPLLGNSVG